MNKRAEDNDTQRAILLFEQLSRLMRQCPGVGTAQILTSLLGQPSGAG
jgi:hypothetical protein